MLKELLASCLIPVRFAGYKPRWPSPSITWRWLHQFAPEERDLVIRLADKIRYISEKKLVDLLVTENRKLTQKLNHYGISNDKIIYVSFDDAGSSSAITLGLLRDADHLERRGFKFVDYARAKDFQALTSKSEEGAVIFVDDFIGSGRQFERCHQICNTFIPTRYGQFLLSGCICEEAFKILYRCGVEAAACIIHEKQDRALHDLRAFTTEEAAMLRDLCMRVTNNGGKGLGYEEMASMIVLYRNTPNNTPFVLRGTIGQDPFIGILPRTTDLLSIAQVKAGHSQPIV